MTDKKIVIDASKCEWRTGVEHYGNYECMLNKCCDYNCDWYKRRKLEQQLKRKEQECKEWKHQAELGVDTTNRLTKELEEKEKECEELKKGLHKNFEEKDTLHLIIDRLLEASGYDTNTASAEDFEDVYEHMRYEQQQLDQLKAELEKYKWERIKNSPSATKEQILEKIEADIASDRRSNDE